VEFVDHMTFEGIHIHGSDHLPGHIGKNWWFIVDICDLEVDLLDVGDCKKKGEILMRTGRERPNMAWFLFSQGFLTTISSLL
jgi:hypothetical protein